MGSCAASDDMAAGERRRECSNNCRRMSLAESVLLLLLLFEWKDGSRPLEGPTVQCDECAVFITTFRLYLLEGAAFLAKQQRRHEQELLLSAARGGASLGRADAAQVCNDVGLFEVDGAFECSSA